jgi:hypothetical protein
MTEFRFFAIYLNPLMSRIIDLGELARNGAQYLNSTQNGIVSPAVPPTWYGLTSNVPIATGAGSLSANVVYDGTPATGDIVHYFNSSGDSGVFTIVNLSAITQALPTVGLFDMDISPVLAHDAVGPVVVYLGYRPGSRSGRSALSAIGNASPPYNGGIFGGSLSTGDTLQYHNADGSSGTTVVSSVSGVYEYIPGFYAFTAVEFTPDIAAGTGSVVFTEDTVPGPASLLATRRNKQSQPRIQ